MFSRIGALLNSIRGYVWLAFSALPTIGVWVAGVYERMPWSSRILVTMATLASGVIFVHYALRTFDYVVEKHGARREINQIIDHLRDLSDEGHAYIKVGMVADMWAGDDKDKPWVWNPKLRKIKRAMAEGRIDYQQRSARQNPSKSSDAKIADVIAYFEGL